jgi:nicotinamide riboside kinase
MDANVMRISICGPESTGKTTLAKQLHNHFPHSGLVLEYAREFLAKQPSYTYYDLPVMALGQKALAEECLATKMCFLDTDALTFVIWSKYVFKRIDPEIWRWYLCSLPDFYLLCKDDLPWEYDPLREHPHERAEIFAIYHDFIKKSGVPFFVVEGEKRFMRAVDAISHFDKTQNNFIR